MKLWMLILTERGRNYSKPSANFRQLNLDSINKKLSWVNNMDNIRNFVIIAHIDHGKSTLADRMLEITGTVEKRKMKEQLLDQMDIERERGITIKMQPVKMEYKSFDGQMFTLNLIDTPGHVDFTYEVSRSLAAVEGAVLLVDVAQGVQAQTIANLYLAIEQGLTIIPVINKVDLPNAEVDKVRGEIIGLVGCNPEDIILASGKTGFGVERILESIVKKIPPPSALPDNNLRALIFDSRFDEYKGVIADVRIFSGEVKPGDKIKFLATKAIAEVLEVGIFKPQLVVTKSLSAGEIGFIATGLKQVSQCRIGDTVARSGLTDTEPLSGYREVKPMVFSGVFCKERQQFGQLKDAMEKLKLNDSALTFEPESSRVLGYGFRVGFLGLLHLEIAQERLKREYGLDLIFTVPSVGYKVIDKQRRETTIKNPLELPDPSQIESIKEPIMKLEIVSPKDYLGNIMQLLSEKRGAYLDTQYLDEKRVLLYYEVPLVSLLVNFYDKLKSVSSGYGSMNYEFYDYKEADVARMDVLVAEEMVESLSMIVYKDEAERTGRKIVESLKETLPRQMFEVKLQAAVGGKIIAAERIAPFRKDVTAKLYGGDITRRMKLLEKQKKGKKKMKTIGKGTVDIPTDTFIKILKK